MLERRILFSDSLPFHCAADDLRMTELRAAFAELMERAAHAVQVAGFEQDDAVIDRSLVCRLGNGAEVEVSADWMSERERLIRHIVTRVAGHGATDFTASHIYIVAIRVAATLERWA